MKSSTIAKIERLEIRRRNGYVYAIKELTKEESGAYTVNVDLTQIHLARSVRRGELLPDDRIVETFSNIKDAIDYVRHFTVNYKITNHVECIGNVLYLKGDFDDNDLDRLLSLDHFLFI